MMRIKKLGFSDERLSALTGKTLTEVTFRRQVLNVHPVYKRIDTCAAEFPSRTPYMYSCYEGDGIEPAECEADPTDETKVIILGGGPNRIGQGIEFDYCCVHAAYALSEAGFETIMINCNPETVSTDYDTSDRLYFEPLTVEDVVEAVRREQTRGTVLGVIVQFGGQTPLKLARALEAANIPILGTSPDSIDLAEDRKRFQAMLEELGLKQPRNGTATSLEEARDIAARLGYPVVIRPSYVLGGRAMQIVWSEDGLEGYMKSAVLVSGDSPVLIDAYLDGAIEVDVDAVCDGTDVYVAGIMQHIEEAGVHSGDSACALPPFSIGDKLIEEMKTQTRALARRLGVIGLMNIQFALKDDTVYLLEVNPRASRTVPFVAKATGVPVAKIASRVMAGEKLAAFGLSERPLGHVAVKEAVFPFARFPGVDIVLGPEMKSTGEVMGLDTDLDRAFAKAQLGAGSAPPMEGTVFVSVRHEDKMAIVEEARALTDMGFRLLATRGTADHLDSLGIPVEVINKVREGRPHCVDAMISGQIHMVINTTAGAQSLKDSFDIRRTALMRTIPHYTTLQGARAAVKAIAALKREKLDVKPLQSYFRG
jgi:carbamoyl-phosphate synthase large subunit